MGKVQDLYGHDSVGSYSTIDDGPTKEGGADIVSPTDSAAKPGDHIITGSDPAHWADGPAAFERGY